FKGVRPSHTVKDTGCNGRCLAQLTEVSKGTWRVQLKLPFYGLNHPLSRAGYTSFRSVHQLPASSPVMIDVELMVASGSKCSRIYDYIRDNSPYRVQMWDMYILISKTKKSGT
ncbi:hypothetical protein JG687_00013609, partial [Phytophthora cactorum]